MTLFTTPNETVSGSDIPKIPHGDDAGETGRTLPGYRRFGRATEGDIEDIEERLADARSISEVTSVLRGIEYLDITDEHLNFIEEEGRRWGARIAFRRGHIKKAHLDHIEKTDKWQNGQWWVDTEDARKKLSVENRTVLSGIQNEHALKKLRQLYWEVIKFDLQHGTRTSGFVSEQHYQELAETDPEAFATGAAKQAKHGVKHRPSMTGTVTHAFNQATRILREHGVDPEDVSVYDLGCGSGKPTLIARMSYKFGNVVGIDYLREATDIGRDNRRDLGLKGDRTIAFREANAGDWTNYRGPVVVCYAYNPFDRKIMRKTVKNLEETGLPVIFLYNKPKAGDLFKTENGWDIEHQVRSLDDDQRLSIYTRNLNQIPLAADEHGPPRPEHLLA